MPEGPTIELMYLPKLATHLADRPRVGWAHIAISLGSYDAVIAVAKRMESSGTLVSGPRWTGDGYFDAVISDPDGNPVEITI
ncbi:VOC family protein [Paraburkholderia sp. BCC1886]|uniref:VOC family protein n=1 Tax=Paraburkholderia sp. BCC1886 TaxID=2562670 RepID=UPI00391F6DEF